MKLPDSRFNEIKTIYFKIWIGSIFGYLFVGRLLQCWADTNVTLALKVLQSSHLSLGRRLMGDNTDNTDGWKWIEIAGNCQKWLKMLEWLEMPGNG